MRDVSRPRAIDLYSGVGGWALGLAAAGIEIVSSYEWWPAAAATERENLGTKVEVCDIRHLELSSLPTDIDLVVGSPPCTQFSYANRGGGGDIADGLVDVRKFLEVVDALQPAAWAMENVPRVASILERELGPKGSLRQFAYLFSDIEVVDASDLGLPQRRRRMVAGRYDGGALRALLTSKVPPRTLGEVLAALDTESIEDPNWSVSLPARLVTENDHESCLDPEETRLNSDAKLQHPVYNQMSFPDRLDRPSRTVTATCTRVSRESIVVASEDGGFRRLSVRERATLQGFPITYQFHGRTHSDKMKMIGNAIPPILAFAVASCMQAALDSAFRPQLPSRLPPPNVLPSVAPNTSSGPAGEPRFSKARRFRASIPGLRFGSGVRFELANHWSDGEVSWRVGFYFGSSKKIESVTLDALVLERLQSRLGSLEELRVAVASEIGKLWACSDSERLQARWSRAGDGLHPHELTDGLGLVSDMAKRRLSSLSDEVLWSAVREVLESPNGDTIKLRRHARSILAGLIVGSVFNDPFRFEARLPQALGTDADQQERRRVTHASG